MPPLHVFQVVSPRPSQPLHSERRSQLAAGAETATLTIRHVFLSYAVALAGTSLLYYQEGAFVEAALLDLVAVLVLACSILANVGSSAPPKKGEQGYTRWMVGGTPRGAMLCAHETGYELHNVH